MTQLSECLGFYLSDTLTRNIKLFAYFLKGPCPSVIKTKTQSQYLLLTVRKRLQNLQELFSQYCLRCSMVAEAASAGTGTFSSIMKSPRWLSSSSPIGVSRETGS